MRKLLLLLLVLYPGIALHAQSAEASIKDRLLHKPLYLCGLWMENKLAFDADGKPTGKVTPFPFTLSGIDIEKVKLGSGKLHQSPFASRKPSPYLLRTYGEGGAKAASLSPVFCGGVNESSMT